MNKLKLNTKAVYKWSSDTIKCPDKKLEGYNYNFYKSLKIDNKEFVIGSGVIIKDCNNLYFGTIHYFYEINFPLQNPYRVAIELFYKPTEISDKLDNFIEFDDDYEVIKKQNLILKHFNVTSLLKHCVLVYGLKEENPLDLIQEFTSTTSDPIYICRFIYCNNNNKCFLIDAVNNKSDTCSSNIVEETETNTSVVVISDSENSDEITSPVEKFTVTTRIEKNSKILLKIKRKSIEKSKKNQTSPSTLLKKLHISENISDINSIDSKFENLVINSPTKPTVLLERINLTNINSEPNKRKSTRISNRSSTKLEPESVASSRSRRSVRKSYAEFYNQQPTTQKYAKINEEIEAPQTPNRKRRTSVVKIETTPKKILKTISTPKSSKVWLKNMTPSIKERDSPIVFGNTPMSRARLGLSAHNVPLKIPCRETEYVCIYNFISVRIKDQTSGCMYISGVPGTGKTMTVCKVMNDMSEQKEDFGEFVFLKLNALALTEPRQIYVQIVKKLLNKKVHWEEALKEINRFFKAKKKKIPHVILIDELDKLCNRKQDVVYNLLDLPFNSVTPLIVITIANTMDLPERILSNKVNSRLGLVRQTFKPYQYKDLVKIVTERLATDAVFKNEALELVARKVAAVSGDARRALTMCSRATEIAEEENKELVTMTIVDKVVKEMSSSSKVQAIQCCSKLEQFVLSSIANEVTRTGNEEVPFLNMLYNLEKCCVLESFKLPAIEIILRSCHRLGSFRLLITQHGKNDLHMTLMLNISTDDVHFALRTNN